MNFSSIKPMLATEHSKAFDSEEYFYEVKWDGYRCLAHFDKKLTLLSRNNQNLTPDFPSLIPDLTSLPGPFILDGELIMLDSTGKPNFSLLQRKVNRTAAKYIVFDLLYWQGKSYLTKPLVTRRASLEKLLDGANGNIFLSKAIDSKGKAFFQAIVAQNLEGMMAKKKDSFYYPGIRSKEWLKIKNRKQLHAIIVGYLPNKRGFKSLYLAQYLENQLYYIGNVGTGFSQQDIQVLLKAMKTLIQAKCPLINFPRGTRDAVWLKPILVATIDYLEFTEEGRLRQPSFIGINPHKPARECLLKIGDNYGN